MGFLLGLDHASLVKVSSRCPRGGDVHHPTVSRKSSHHKDSRKDHQKKNKCGHEQSSDECNVDCNSSNEEAIQECLMRTLSSMSNPKRKLSLVKINKATSQVVSGVKYTVAFDAKDEISGESYTSEAVIVSEPWTSEEPQLVDIRCSSRASLE